MSTLPVRIANTASGAVVLLHSSSASGRQWRATAEALAPRWSVHAPDFHGHGTQPAWTSATPMSLADEAAVIEPLLERCGGAHLVGHSYGAAVALKLASRRPALVRSVVAYEPVLFSLLLDDPGSRDELYTVVGVAEAMRSLLASGQAHAATQRFIDFWCGAGSWAALPPPRQDALAARTPAVVQHFDALFADPLCSEDLARLRMPLLLLRGQATLPVAQRLVQLVRAARPSAEHAVLPALGHMGPLTDPDVFNPCVRAFLDAQVPQAAPARLATLTSLTST